MSNDYRAGGRIQSADRELCRVEPSYQRIYRARHFEATILTSVIVAVIVNDAYHVGINVAAPV
jgi:hypothetical protein